MTSSVRPATWWPRKASSSSECGRARPSTSLVPSATRANLPYAYASSSVSRPPGRTATPTAVSRGSSGCCAARSPAAATSRASTQLAGSSSPSALRTSGVVMRSGADCHVNAKRSLSVIHSWFTVGSSPASRRSTTPRRWSMRMAEPCESCSAMPGVETRSNGRDRNRYAALVRAPTGQICTVLPEKYDANGRPEVSSAAAPSGASPTKPSTEVSKVPICWLAPRFCRSMKTSPAISSENRVHRWHRMQRSRSSRIWVEIAIGLGNVRLTSTNRVLARPLLIAWFCRGHSPPLSHTGQSRGWLISSSSMTPCWALSASGDVCCVLTCMPGVASRVQLACGLGILASLPSRPGAQTSTRHWRQAPAGASSGWSQKRGIWMPSCSAARMTRVPLGTAVSMPSTVNVTVSPAGSACGDRCGRDQGRRRVAREDRIVMRAPPRECASACRRTGCCAPVGTGRPRGCACRPRTRTGSTGRPT